MRKAKKLTKGRQKPLTEVLHSLFKPTAKRAPAPARTPKGRVTQALALTKRKNDPRIEVVSEKLCDDVLKYLAPTLQAHKGCTIIDLNPGPCVWSDKVHQFLKPTCHILMEPEEKYVKPFIQPLLTRPRSKYKHVALSGTHFDTIKENFDQLFNGDLIPKKELRSTSPKLRKLNTSILVIGNLARYTRGKVFKQSGAGFNLQAIATSSLTNDLFHRYGLVRTLLWFPEFNKWPFFPHINAYRTFQSMNLGMSSNLSEVVAVKPGTAYINGPGLGDGQQLRSRYAGFIAESAKQVQERMGNLGMVVPEGRSLLDVLGTESSEEKLEEMSTEGTPAEEPSSEETSTDIAESLTTDALDTIVDSPMGTAVETLINGSTDTPTSEEQAPIINMTSPLEIHHQTLEDAMKALEALTKRVNDFAGVCEDIGRAKNSLKAVALSRPFVNTLQYPQILDMTIDQPLKGSPRRIIKELPLITKNPIHRARESRAGSISANIMRGAAYADLILSQVNLEAHCSSFEEKDHDVTELRSGIATIQGILTSIVAQGNFSRAHQININGMVEDTLSFFSSPPLLGHDRRQYEPLQAAAEDFWPRAHLCLFDMTPIDRDLTAEGIATRDEVVKMWRILSGYLFGVKNQSIASALDKIAPNAANDLIPMVPAISDPRRGGRLDPKLVKVRCMTEEMLVGLVKAWYEWPFRPETWEVALSMTSDASIRASTHALTPEAVTAADDD